MNGLELATVRSSAYEEVEASKWNSRAWTFQEKLCSRRTLIFTDSLVIFWCAKTVYREDVCMEDVDEEPPGLYDNLNPISDFLRPNRRMRTRDQLYDARFSFILMHYLQKELSTADDILNAFAGIAGAMRPRLGNFRYGLPEQCFQRALSWKHRNVFRRRNGFPSWSWAGWHHATQFTNSDLYYHSQDFRPLLTVCWFVGLGSEGLVRKIPGGAVTDDKKAHPHFKSFPAGIEARFRTFAMYGINTLQLIAFLTSSSALSISSEPHHNEEPPWWEGDREVMAKYAIQRPQTSDIVGDIVLDRAWVSANVTPKSLHDFIVICPHKGMDESWDDPNFLLMLIKWKDGIAYRIQMSGPVKGTEWWKCETKRTLVILG